MNKCMQVAICDDDPKDLQEITEITQKIAAEKAFPAN